MGFLREDKTMNTAKKHAGHAIKQVEILNYLIHNLSQFNLKPTTKLVLLYLAGCYNHKHVDFFPKQKTIALQMGISERSVISAIQELHKEGLVISERKYTNRYRFTSRILNLGGIVEDFSEPEKIAEAKCKDCTLETENSAPPYIEQEKEQIKEPEKVEDYKILKDYAISKGAKNIKAYIDALKQNGSATKIIQLAKEKLKIESYHAKRIEETNKLLADIRNQKADNPANCEILQNVLKRIRK